MVKKDVKVLTPSEYRKLSEPEWKQGPSGQYYLISGMKPVHVGMLINVLGISGEAVKIDRGKVLDKLDEVRDTLIPQCIVEPKIRVEVTDPETELSTSDLLTADVIFLIDNIIAKTGLAVPEERERRSFR